MTTFGIMLEQHRERLTRPVTNPYNLTKLEQNIAAWLGVSATEEAIAQKLEMGASELSEQVRIISEKLGARNRTHLGLIINTLPGLPVEQPNIVVIEDFRAAFGMG